MSLDPLLDFSNKVVLLTGAASGFGAIMAREFSSRGAKLVLGDINEAGLNALAEELPGDVVTRLCNVTKEADCQGLVETAEAEFGRLDIAINNAGGGQPLGKLTTITEETLDRQFALNAKSVAFGMKHQINQMLKQGDGGAILNVSSMAGLAGAPTIGGYCMAKHAVIGATRTAAVEFAKQNIRVNAVCPFFSPTPLITDSALAPAQEALAQGSPMKRLGSPEEMTNVMLMLCSPGNTYMTGQAIAIDGGLSAS